MLHQGHGTATQATPPTTISPRGARERGQEGSRTHSTSYLRGQTTALFQRGLRPELGPTKERGFPGGSWKSESVGAVSIAPAHPHGRQGCAAVKGLHGARTRPGCRRALNASRDSLLWRSHRAGGVPVTTSRFVTSPWGLWRDWPYPRTGIKS